ncbi:MAG: diaminopimelate decarboxylase [Bacteroidales bacterium]|nr:diaminopimelate decarboxylase [Candidatus Liminaster caballi]
MFPINQFENIQTPFYYYDRQLLQQTLDVINREAAKHPGFCVHYAVKANVDPTVLDIIRQSGLGCDCVSGGEVDTCLKVGFEASKIVFAGVGKADWEINLALDADILCFNVESLPELEVISQLAAAKGRTARVAIRVNPNVDAHTHKYITTGLSENKFGISMEMLDDVLAKASAMPNIELVGLHFHIGSQLLELQPFEMLCNRINELQDKIEAKGIRLKSINVGGGLGCDYEDPDKNPIPDFASYFDCYARHLQLRPGQELHFELGRSVVCQMGSLITRVLYVKHGINKKFVILDAGMSDLIRPALYQAHHRLDNISADAASQQTDTYDVVGPICESSDCFGTDEQLPVTKRGDLFAIRSAGAYGQIMASQYNCRRIPSSLVL